MDNYTVNVKVEDLPEDSKISARHVSNVNLAETGGWALVGEFIKNMNYKKNGEFEFSSHLPIVVMMKVGNDNAARRAALVFIAAHDKLELVDQAEFKWAGLTLEAKVSEGGTVFGFYLAKDKVTVADESLLHSGPVHPNPYYEVAIDLASLEESDIVMFPHAPEPVLSHDKKNTLHGNLPRLPKGYEWGPEIGGVMTVKKVLDPYTIFFVDQIIGTWEVDSLGIKHARVLRDFLADQAARMGAVSKTYEYMTHVYFDNLKK